MFRRLSSSLPRDPQIPKDLSALGYFINDQDQIRQIKSPEKGYDYQVNRNERVNEMHKDAMNGCIRTMILDRLEKLNLEQLPVPLGTSQEDRHTKILVSKELRQKKRVLVIFGERHQDLGIFSYRVTGNDSISQGSAIELVTAIDQTLGADGIKRGIIITNPGQLLWRRSEGRAITYSEWMSLPRQTAVHDAMAIDSVKNTVPRNRDYREHVEYVFEHVMRELVHEDVKFELIGLESTGHAMIDYLAKNWKDWSERIDCICLGSPQHTAKELKTNGQDFADFMGKRCRAYVVSTSPRETFLTGREEYGCNCYASGEAFYQENIIIAAWRSMLDWFNLIEMSPEYEEVEILVKGGGDKDEESKDKFNAAAAEAN